MGLKRITARIEVTYPADYPGTLEQLRTDTPAVLTDALLASGGVPSLAYYTHLNAAVDPDAEQELPPEPDPDEQNG